MPTTLTSPIVRSATVATVDSWSLTIGRNANFSANLPDTWLNATVIMRHADGTEASRSSFSVAQPGWGAPLTTTVRNFHTAIIAAMRNAGLLPAGTDTQDV